MYDLWYNQLKFYCIYFALGSEKPNKEADGICRVETISWDGGNEKLSTVSEVQQLRENKLDEFFFSDVGGLSDYSKLSKVIKMILLLVCYGQW